MLSVVFIMLLNIGTNILLLLLLKEFREGIRRDKVKFEPFGHWFAHSHSSIVIAPTRFRALILKL
jgi:hypothetical protein